MKKIKVAIVGAGNISNTRHIPALKKLKNAKIVGVVGVRKRNLENTMQKHGIKNILLLKKDRYSESLSKSAWFTGVDAVVIGAPPKEHYALVKASLENGKHVLIEKPMTMSVKESEELVALAKKVGKRLSVMHNFQYASGMQRLESKLESGELGEIVSFFEVQLTNKNRRLPEWYNDLPLGLFYDEAAHFIYLLERFGGKIKVKDANAQFSKDKNDNTPTLMNVSLKAGNYPASIFLNFEAPICEWFFVVSCSEKIAVYDLFKDILIILPSDNEHYAADILKNSWRTTFQYWKGFISNGFKMVTGNLLYGHDVVLNKFLESTLDPKKIDHSISGQRGSETVRVMNEIVKAVGRR